MRNWISLVATLTVIGCAYQNPYIPQLRANSSNQANTYAMQVTTFLEYDGTPEEAISKTKAAIAAMLKDPNSAQFRNVRIVKDNDRKQSVVCGEVNGKNSYGGYVGFVRFIGSMSGGTLESKGGRYPEIDYAANDGLIQWCSR